MKRKPDPPKIGRNEPCHCGSGRKYKKCHLITERKAEGERWRRLMTPLEPIEDQSDNALQRSPIRRRVTPLHTSLVMAAALAGVFPTRRI